ncbi:hypothetical protein [Streptomyces sp. AC550_RSS872]|nr:hypothetical protein [Streptomyces sp. AC550_RSS872]
MTSRPAAETVVPAPGSLPAVPTAVTRSQVMAASRPGSPAAVHDE